MEWMLWVASMCIFSQALLSDFVVLGIMPRCSQMWTLHMKYGLGGFD